MGKTMPYLFRALVPIFAMAMLLFDPTSVAGQQTEIAGELRLSTTEALEVLGSVGAKLRYFSSPRTPGR